jgi:hypothetical protein
MRPFPRKIEINPAGIRPLAPSSPSGNGPLTPRSEAGPISSNHQPTSGSGYPPSAYQTHHHLTGYPPSGGPGGFMRQPSPGEQFSHPEDLDDDDHEHGVDSFSAF